MQTSEKLAKPYAYVHAWAHSVGNSSSSSSTACILNVRPNQSTEEKKKKKKEEKHYEMRIMRKLSKSYVKTTFAINTIPNEEQSTNTLLSITFALLCICVYVCKCVNLSILYEWTMMVHHTWFFPLLEWNSVENRFVSELVFHAKSHFVMVVPWTGQKIRWRKTSSLCCWQTCANGIWKT